MEPGPELDAFVTPAHDGIDHLVILSQVYLFLSLRAAEKRNAAIMTLENRYPGYAHLLCHGY